MPALYYFASLASWLVACWTRLPCDGQQRAPLHADKHVVHIRQARRVPGSDVAGAAATRGATNTNSGMRQRHEEAQLCCVPVSKETRTPDPVLRGCTASTSLITPLLGNDSADPVCTWYGVLRAHRNRRPCSAARPDGCAARLGALQTGQSQGAGDGSPLPLALV
jgi:hypothetical protein